MAAAAAELDFEKAARLRDDLGALRRAVEKQAVVLRRRHRRRCGRHRRRRPARLGAGVPRPRRPGPRPARLDRRRGRRQRRARQGWARWWRTSCCSSTAAAPTTTERPRCRGRSWCRCCRPRTAATEEELTGWLVGPARVPGVAAGAAARRQAGAGRDRHPQRRRGADPAPAEAGQRSDRPVGRADRARRHPGHGRRATADRVHRRLACAGHRCGGVAGGVRGRAAQAQRLPPVRHPGAPRRRRGVHRRSGAAAVHPRREDRTLPRPRQIPPRTTPTSGTDRRRCRGTGPEAGTVRRPSRPTAAASTRTTGRPRRFAYPPQLLVVDGGAPQVNAAATELAELGIVDVTICGLAKRLEEVWVPAQDEPIIFPRTSEALYLLQRLRDEAHRFAITYHRAKRSKSMTVSALDNVAGLGEVRRKALVRHFGSVAALRRAGVEDILEVPGIGRRTAEAVVAALAEARDRRPSAPTRPAGHGRSDVPTAQPARYRYRRQARRNRRAGQRVRRRGTGRGLTMAADERRTGSPGTAAPSDVAVARRTGTEGRDPGGHRLRTVRRRAVDRGEMPGGPGLVRGRQPAAGADHHHGRPRLADQRGRHPDRDRAGRPVHGRSPRIWQR